MRLVISTDKAIVIILEGLKQNDTRGVLVAEEGDSIIHTLLQIAEADDIAEGFDAVQNAVCAAECLNQAMHLQVLINPKRVEGLSIKASQEHTYHYQQVHLSILHTEG